MTGSERDVWWRKANNQMGALCLMEGEREKCLVTHMPTARLNLLLTSLFYWVFLWSRVCSMKWKCGIMGKCLWALCVLVSACECLHWWWMIVLLDVIFRVLLLIYTVAMFSFRITFHGSGCGSSFLMYLADLFFVYCNFKPFCTFSPFHSNFKYYALCLHSYSYKYHEYCIHIQYFQTYLVTNEPLIFFFFLSVWKVRSENQETPVVSFKEGLLLLLHCCSLLHPKFLAKSDLSQYTIVFIYVTRGRGYIEV